MRVSFTDRRSLLKLIAQKYRNGARPQAISEPFLSGQKLRKSRGSRGKCVIKLKKNRSALDFLFL